MRRALPLLLLLAALPRPTAPANAQAMPPHAWLFGSWTGGLFPAPTAMTAQACLSAPVVIFTRDVVLRATLMDVGYIQRSIETVRNDTTGTQFRFVPGPAAQTGLLTSRPATVLTGFGCESPDGLLVQRKGENEIVFPNCADFPNPLVRCPAR